MLICDSLVIKNIYTSYILKLNSITCNRKKKKKLYNKSHTYAFI